MNSRKALCAILILLVGTVMVQGATVSISKPSAGSFVGGQITIVSNPIPNGGATVTALLYGYKIGDFVGLTNAARFLECTAFAAFTTAGGDTIANPRPGTEFPSFPFDARSTATSGLPNAADFVDGTCQKFNIMVQATFSDVVVISDPREFSIDNRLPPNPLALDLNATGSSTDSSTPEVIWFNGGEHYAVTENITLTAPDIIAENNAFDDDEDTGLNKGDTVIIVDATPAANNGVYRLSVTVAPDEDELRIDTACTGCSFGENTSIATEVANDMTMVRPSSDDLWSYNQAMLFNAAGTITDPGNGFADFKINDTIEIFGGVNDGDQFQVTTVAAGVLTITPNPVAETVPALVMCKGADIYGYNIVASRTVPSALEETRTDSFPPDTLSLPSDGTYTVYYRTGDDNSDLNSDRNWSAEANQGTITFTPPVINFGVVPDDNTASGSEATSPVTISVSIYAADGVTKLVPTDAIAVNYSVSGGTATVGGVPPGDFTGGTGTLVFSGVDTQTFDLIIVNDSDNEADETIELLLSGEVNGNLGTRDTFTYTIVDNDVNLTITDVTQSEGDALDITDFDFRVSLSSAQSSTVTVNYTTNDGTALAGADYTADANILTFAAGVTSQTITISVTGDVTNEADETFTVDLTTPLPAGAAIADAQGLGTIQNDDGLTISIDAAEGPQAENVTPLLFDVRLSAVSGQTVTVLANTADDTALAPGDYTAVVGQLLTFNAGTTHLTFAVTLTDDAINECDETFTTSLTTPTGSLVTIDAGTGTGTGTVTDEDNVQIDIAAPANDVEGNNYTFTITLDTASVQSITVNYSTNAGTATTADYTHSTGTVTFVPGDTSEIVNVAITDDALNECDEAFTMDLTTPAATDCVASVTINTDTATATILASDAVQVSATAPGAGAEASSFVFTVDLDTVSTQTVTIDYTTADGTATSAGDYTATSGTLTFNPGVTSLTVPVASTGDAVNECDETFDLDLTNPTGLSCASVSIAAGAGSVTTTINDDDAVQVSATAPGAGAEGSSFVFTVDLDTVSTQTVTIDYTTADGTATSAGDYMATNGTLTFNPGVTSLTVPVASTGDAVNECDETFDLDLTNPTGLSCASVSIAAGTATTTINADAAVQVSVTAPGAGVEATSFVFTVELDIVSTQTVTIDYSTADGTATSAGDYTATSGTLTFNPGVTSLTVPVASTGDGVNECDETFDLDLTNPTGLSCASVSIAGGSATATINDDDDLAITIVGDGPKAEGSRFVFTLTMAPASEQDVAVDWQTLDGSATSGGDYTGSGGPQTVTFAAGTTSMTVGVDTTDDAINECDEAFSVDLTNADPASCAAVVTLGVAAEVTVQDTPDIVQITLAGPAPVTEGSDSVFTVTLDRVSEQTITVDYTTTDGTAGAADYTPAAGVTLTFSPGVTARTIDIATADDAVNEAAETFDLDLTTPTGVSCGNATIAAGNATATINDNDALTISIDDVGEDEGDAGTVPFVFTVTLSAVSEQVITVDYDTVDGTATSAADYVDTGGTLTFGAGTTSQTLTVEVNGDLDCENNEIFTVELTTPTGDGVTIADGSGTGTINDDEVFLGLDQVTGRENNWVYVAVELAVCEDLQALIFSITYESNDLTYVEGSEMVLDGVRVDANQVIIDSDADGKLVVVVQGVQGDTNIIGGNGNILALSFRIRPGMTIGLASALTLGDVNATGIDGEEIVLDTQDGDITAVTTQFKVDGDESGDPTAPTTVASGGRAISSTDAVYLYRAVKYGAFDFVPVIPQSVRDAAAAEFTSDREIVSFVRGLGNALDVDGDLNVEAEQDLVYLYRFIDNGGAAGPTVPPAHAAVEADVEAAIQLNLGLLDPPVNSTVVADDIDPIVDSAATTEPADGTTDPLVIYFSESLRDDGTTNLIADNGPVGFITSSRGVVDGDFSITVSGDGRSVSVAPIGGNWSTGETVTVDMDTVDDVAGNQGSDNDTGDADNTHTFTIP